MKKIFSCSLAFLLLLPSLLCAKSIAVSETQASSDLLSSPELQYLTDVLREEAVRALPASQDWTIMSRESSAGSYSADFKVQAQVSKFGSSLAISTELYESASNRLVASFTGKGASVEDIERIIKEQAPALFKKILEQTENNTDNSAAGDTNAVAPAVVLVPQEQTDNIQAPTVTETATATEVASDSATQEMTSATVTDSTLQEQAAADSLQSNPVAPDTVKVASKVEAEVKDTSKVAPVVKEEKIAETKDGQNKPKRIWGGITAGVTYNDFLDTKFGLDNIPQGEDYSVTVEGADKLLDNYWGIGFKAGFGIMFMFNDFFNLRGDLNIALRQGTGKANSSVIVSWDDEDYDDEKNDLKLEYSATQLNIDLPLLARVTIPNAVYFEVGPMFSFNVYAKNKVTIKDYHGSKTYEEKGGLKAFEFDIATGLGVMRHIGKSILDIDLRFVIGMTRISDSKDSPKTWQGQLNITYWFL